MKIAIDGPSGSGKSSVAKAIATKYGWGYVDTGAMYRACAWFVLERGIDIGDQALVAASAADIEITLKTNPQSPGILVGQVDVTDAIRESVVTDAVSQVSAVPEIRSRMVAVQRQLARDLETDLGGVVMEGRDIGSAVLTDASVKIFLTADVAARAARRAAEDTQAGRTVEADVAGTSERLAARDYADTNRAASPLTRVGEATEIDATFMNLREVISAVDSLIQDQLASSQE